MRDFSAILRDNKFNAADVATLESKLFFEGDRSQRYLVRFSVLLFLSAVIAAQGVIEDSTATVIGAMIIAPLMTPILATTAALVMGDGARAWRSVLLVAAGVLGVILVATMLGVVAVHIIDFKTNSQISSRVAPRVLDLIIALAAGTAGAFAMSRDDVADSLPGVAISIALVPPLCVAGIALSGARWADAGGAFLLFLTNFLSILLAGGAVFGVLELGVTANKNKSALNKRRAYRIIAVGVALVAIPLSLTTVRVWQDSTAQIRITNLANVWVRQYAGDVVVSSVLVMGRKADILISGPNEPSTISELGAEIASEVERVEEVNLRFVPSREYSYPERK